MLKIVLLTLMLMGGAANATSIEYFGQFQGQTVGYSGNFEIPDITPGSFILDINTNFSDNTGIDILDDHIGTGSTIEEDPGWLITIEDIISGVMTPSQIEVSFNTILNDLTLGYTYRGTLDALFQGPFFSGDLWIDTSSATITNPVSAPDTIALLFVGLLLLITISLRKKKFTRSQ